MGNIIARVYKHQIFFPMLLAIIACLVPLFVTAAHILSIFVLTFYVAIASMSWNILGGMTGQNSLGHASLMGVGAYVSAIIVTRTDISPWVSLPIAMVVVGLLAMVAFYPCFILRGPYFTLVTIAIGEVLRNFFINWEFAGRANGILLPFGADSFVDFRFLSRVPYYYAGLILMLAVYFFIRKMDNSKLGFALKTIRENEDVAASIGINPTKYKVIAVGISASVAAIAGFFYVQFFRYIDPDIMLPIFSVEFVLPAVIGGSAFVGGPVLGALILIPLSEFLRAQFGAALPGVNLLIYSAILIMIIRFQPVGILGWWHNHKRRAVEKGEGVTHE